MQPQYLKILTFIDANGGRVRVDALDSIEGSGSRYLGPLCIGRVPNCLVNNNFVAITERGVKTLVENGITPMTATAPIVKRDSELTKKSIIQVIIDRNKEVEITCKVNTKLAEFILANGRRTKVTQLGDAAVRNWDCTEETYFVTVNLGELDRNFSNETKIISDYGINPLIIKLAAANGGTWKVCYKGLVSRENLEAYAKRLQEGCKKFYLDYVKPVKIEVNLNMWE